MFKTPSRIHSTQLKLRRLSVIHCASIRCWMFTKPLLSFLFPLDLAMLQQCSNTMSKAKDTASALDAVDNIEFREVADGWELDVDIGGVKHTLVVRSSEANGGSQGALRIAKICLAHHHDGASWDKVEELRDEMYTLPLPRYLPWKRSPFERDSADAGFS